MVVREEQWTPHAAEGVPLRPRWQACIRTPDGLLTVAYTDVSHAFAVQIAKAYLAKHPVATPRARP